MAFVNFDFGYFFKVYGNVPEMGRFFIVGDDLQNVLVNKHTASTVNIDYRVFGDAFENINELDAKVNLIRDRLDPFARITDTEEKALKTKEMEYEAYPTFLKNYYGQKIPIVSKIETISLNDGREACIIPRALMAVTAIKL